MHYLFILFLLTYLSIVDIKTREVPNAGAIIIFCFAFLIIDMQGVWQNLPFALAIFLVLVIFSSITDESIGGGDVKLISALAFFMGKDIFLLSIPMAVLIIGTLIWALIKRKGLRYEIPFVPYIFASYLFYLGVYVWNMAYRV